MRHNILVTGSTGFVGKNLLSFFKAKPNIVLSTISLRNRQLEDFDKNITQIIHLAAKAHDLKNVSDPSEYFEVNTALTQALFDKFLKSDATDFIYISSVKAAADSSPGVLYEDVNPSPQTPYGKSKRMAEEYILSSKLPAGKRCIILRPCMIHGPGNKGNLNLLYKFVKKGIPYPLAAFDNKRSFLSIDNLVFVIDNLINNPQIASGIYNVADDESLSTNEVISIISNTIKLKPRLWHLNKKMIETLAFVGDKLHLPLNSERLKKLTENYVVSNEKIKEALGISRMPVTATHGLITTIKSFLPQ